MRCRCRGLPSAHAGGTAVDCVGDDVEPAERHAVIEMPDADKRFRAIGVR